jgi:hypothetical protein
MQLKMNPQIVKTACIVSAVTVSSFLGWKLYQWCQAKKALKAQTKIASSTSTPATAPDVQM